MYDRQQRLCETSKIYDSKNVIVCSLLAFKVLAGLSRNLRQLILIYYNVSNINQSKINSKKHSFEWKLVFINIYMVRFGSVWLGFMAY